MATTYKASFEFECWKQHTCVSCNDAYQYVLKRKVEGEAGTEEAAFAAAQGAAVTAMENDVDVHPCPGCGHVQPDMIAAQQTPWYWWSMLVGVGGVMIAFFPALAHGFSIETSAMVAAVPMGLALFLALIGSLRNPNSDLQGNQIKAGRKVDEGLLKAIPAADREDDADLELEDEGMPASFSSANTMALVMLVMGLAAAFAPPLVRTVSGWPLNDRWYPAVVGPGDESTFYFREELSSVKGYWRVLATEEGQNCWAIVQNADELEIPRELLTGRTKESKWGDRISVSRKSSKEPSNNVWAAFEFPEHEALEGAEGLIAVEVGVLYPALAMDGWEPRQKVFVEENVPLNFASAGAGASYHRIWMMGQIAAMVLCVMAGVTLLRAAGGLVTASHPTTVFPIEGDGDGEGSDGEEDPFPEADDLV